MTKKEIIRIALTQAFRPVTVCYYLKKTTVTEMAKDCYEVVFKGFNGRTNEEYEETIVVIKNKAYRADKR